MGQDIPIRKSKGLQYSRFFIDYGLSGRIKNFLFQPPGLKLTITLENGESKTFRTSRTNLDDGLIVNKYINDSREFRLMLLSDGAATIDIVSVRIEPDGSGYKPTLRMTNLFYAWDNKTPEEANADSTKISNLVNGYRKLEPLPQPPSDSARNDFVYGIDCFNDHGGYVRISGWAFRKNEDNSHILVQPVARSTEGGALYAFPSEMGGGRSDLADSYKRADLVNTGFNSALSRSQLPPLNYRIGLLITNKDNGRSWIRMTDHYISTSIPEPIAPVAALPPGKSGIALDVQASEVGNDWLIQGWAALPGARPAIHVILQSREKAWRVDAELRSRPDIAAKYKNAALEYTGLYVRIPRDSLPEGTYGVYIEKSYPDGKPIYAITEARVLIDAGKINVPVKIDNLPPAAMFDADITVKEEEENFTIGGWAIRDMKAIDTDSIQVLLIGNNNTLYALSSGRRLRPDVTAAYHNGLNLDNCGFNTRLAKGILHGKFRLGIRIYPPGRPGVCRLMDNFVEF